MSTSDPEAGAAPLDPEILARLASEMFRALPQTGGTPAVPTAVTPPVTPDVAPVAGAPVPGGPSSPATPSLRPGGRDPGSFAVPDAHPSLGPGGVAPAPFLGGIEVGTIEVPGDAHLRSLLAGQPSRLAGPNVVGPAGAPRGTEGSSLPATPSLRPGGRDPGSFAVPDAHPSVVPGGVAPAPFLGGLDVGTIEVPGDAHLRSLLAGQPSRVAGPNVVGPAGAPRGTEGSSFYFLEYARPTGGSPQVPGFLEGPAVPGGRTPGPPLDVDLIRRDFPILEERVHGRKLVWLDNAATTQKPRAVIDRLRYFYEHENSNIHRAAHELAARATDAYEDAREKVRTFLNAATKDEIVYVRGGTEAINLVAQAWGRKNIGKGDEIVITWLEHHANIVPWYRLCEETGAHLRVVPVDDRGQVLLDAYAGLLGPRTKLVSLTHVSNALGTVTPAHQMVAMAHAVGARVLVDGAQAVSHMPVDVQSLGCDFYVFSGHKVFAPTGIGVLYGRKEVLDGMDPWQGGGNMIQDVTFEQIRYQGPPARFEAGTPSIGDAVGLGAAIAYVSAIGMPAIAAYEHALLEYGTHVLQTVPGLRLIGTAAEKAGVLSFVLDGFDTAAVGKALDREGIAVRAGHHCAQPILRRFGLESTVRPSLALYNNRADLDALVSALRRLTSGRVPRALTPS